MQLEDYFNFLAPNDIRLKGSRIGIETILYEYIYRARTPEEIANTYTCDDENQKLVSELWANPIPQLKVR